MATTIQPNYAGNSLYDQQMRDQAASYGITPEQLYSIYQSTAGTPSSTAVSPGGGNQSGGFQNPGPAPYGAQDSALQTLSVLKSLGLTGGNQKAAAPVDPAAAADAARKANPLGALGTAALGAVGR
jgi:hypothetical protein